MKKYIIGICCLIFITGCQIGNKEKTPTDMTKEIKKSAENYHTIALNDSMKKNEKKQYLKEYREKLIEYLNIEDTWKMSEEQIINDVGENILFETVKGENVRAFTLLLETQMGETLNSTIIQMKEEKKVKAYLLYDWSERSVSDIELINNDTLLIMGHHLKIPFPLYLSVMKKDKEKESWKGLEQMKTSLPKEKDGVNIAVLKNEVLFGATEENKNVEQANGNYDAQTKTIKIGTKKNFAFGKYFELVYQNDELKLKP